MMPASSYTHILHPDTGKVVPISSNDGLRLLKNYVHTLVSLKQAQEGGRRVDAVVKISFMDDESQQELLKIWTNNDSKIKRLIGHKRKRFFLYDNYAGFVETKDYIFVKLDANNNAKLNSDMVESIIEIGQNINEGIRTTLEPLLLESEKPFLESVCREQRPFFGKPKWFDPKRVHLSANFTFLRLNKRKHLKITMNEKALIVSLESLKSTSPLMGLLKKTKNVDENGEIFEIADQDESDCASIDGFKDNDEFKGKSLTVKTIKLQDTEPLRIVLLSTKQQVSDNQQVSDKQQVPDNQDELYFFGPHETLTYLQDEIQSDRKEDTGNTP